MPKLDLAYNRQVSLVLVAGFSLALLVVAGWLVFTIMSANGTGSMASDQANPIPPESSQVESDAAVPPLAAEDRPDAAAAGSTAMSVPVVSVTAPAGVAQGGQGDLLPQEGGAATALPRLRTVPLPHPRPKRAASGQAPASVPVPRRRPTLDTPRQAARDWSVFDLFTAPR